MVSTELSVTNKEAAVILGEADASQAKGSAVEGLDIRGWSNAEAPMPVPISPGEVEVYGRFSKHLGPRFLGAGLRLQFHCNQTPGIYFKAAVNEEYRKAILNGFKDGMSARFPDFPETGSIWITEVSEQAVDSSRWAFDLAARSCG